MWRGGEFAISDCLVSCDMFHVLLLWYNCFTAYLHDMTLSPYLMISQSPRFAIIIWHRPQVYFYITMPSQCPRFTFISQCTRFTFMMSRYHMFTIMTWHCPQVYYHNVLQNHVTVLRHQGEWTRNGRFVPNFTRCGILRLNIDAHIAINFLFYFGNCLW